MATLSKIATLRLDDAATHTTNVLSWTSTAAIEQTAEGGSVVITTVRTTAGVPPADPDTLTLKLYDDAGVLVRAFTLNTTAASQTSTFFFTDTGATGGVARHGTYEIALRATNTTSPAPWDVETDGAPNTPPPTFDSHLDRGYIIGTTTKVHVFSNVAAGGAKLQPAEYDESLFFRVTLGSASAVARSLAVVLSAGALSGNTNSTTSATRDVSFANVTDDRFPAAVTTLTATVTAPNATLTGLPYTVFTATTADSINVDPRLTVSAKLWQVDDDVFGTPPMSKNDASRQALVSSYSGLAMRLVTARTATGVNGLTTNIALDPRSPGSIINRASPTATRGGEAGWTDLAQLGPFVVGGAWDATLTITAPADIDGAGYIVSPTEVVTILAPDPRVAIIVAFGPFTASEDDHLHAGDSMALSVSLFSRDAGRRLAPDAGTVTVRFIRWNRTAARFEFLATDGTTWTAWTGSTTTADTHTLTDTGDGVTFTKTLASTSGWGTADVVAVQVTAKVGGTPYGFYVGRELTGTPNGHSAYALDAVGLALSGALSFK